MSAVSSSIPASRPRAARVDHILAGVLAVAVVLGIAEVVAAFLVSPSLVIAVGDVVIDSVPGGLERAVIAVLGTADKPFLISMILLVSLVIGAGIGVVAARRFALAALTLLVYTATGVAAALADPQSNLLGPVLTGSVGAGAGVLVLRSLLDARRPVKRGDARQRTPRSGEGPAVDRRRFLRLAGAATAVAALGAIGGRAVAGGTERINRIRQAIRLPRPARAAAAAPAGADLGLRGLTPLYVANEDFYRIDTALRVPRIDPETWSLQIRGRVDRPYRLSYAELLAMPHIEADITLACVSNEVGGGLVGNARWQGVPLHSLLERAGVQDGAEQVIGRAVDGFTAGFPTRTALRVQDAMVAVAMNGEPLPIEHGFPARLVVPGLYGYVSATKWLAAIELRGWNEVEGYWIPRGWAKEGPVKTQSRIDVPAASSTVTAGRRPIAGVAWAPTRGIARVEVSIDDGPWRAARLAAALDVDCWRQWSLAWDATPGRHTIAVRATDASGEVQTDVRRPVAPDGASGHHTIEVSVS